MGTSYHVAALGCISIGERVQWLFGSSSTAMWGPLGVFVRQDQDKPQGYLVVNFSYFSGFYFWVFIHVLCAWDVIGIFYLFREGYFDPFVFFFRSWRGKEIMYHNLERIGASEFPSKSWAGFLFIREVSPIAWINENLENFVRSLLPSTLTAADFFSNLCQDLRLGWGKPRLWVGVLLQVWNPTSFFHLLLLFFYFTGFCTNHTQKSISSTFSSSICFYPTLIPSTKPADHSIVHILLPLLNFLHETNHLTPTAH